jgi:hypothetical protein
MINALFVFDERLRPRFIQWLVDRDELLMHEARREISDNIHNKEITIISLGKFFVSYKRKDSIIFACISTAQEDYYSLTRWAKGIQVLLGVARMNAYDFINGYALIKSYTLLSLSSGNFQHSTSEILKYRVKN